MHDGTGDKRGLLRRRLRQHEGVTVAVVWLRYFTAEDPGYGFVADAIPELSIWVHSDHRGRGIGGRLLNQVAEQARTRGVSSISRSRRRDVPQSQEINRVMV